MKKYILMIFALALFLVLFINDDAAEVVQQETSYYSTASSSSVSFVSSSTGSASSISHQGQLNQSSSTSSVWSYKEPLEEKVWRHSRGLFYDGELIDYEGYKLDKLEELASKGDLKSIEVLRRYERSSGNVKRYKELTDLGVVYGSLGALRGLSTEKISNYLLNRTEENLLEMFAYKEFQAKRGDLFIKSKIPVDYKIYDFYPTQEQAEHINRRSDELKVDYEKRREEMGLPPFDNSTLASDRELYGE